MNREALRQGVRVLKFVKKKEFDLRSWDCGTTACAIGHMCKDNWFKKKGLYVKRGPIGIIEPHYGSRIGWHAVSRFFDIPLDQAFYLFGRWRYLQDKNKPKHVIKRLKEWL